jgi:Spy/CpxP family protein refolding chaperone
MTATGKRVTLGLGAAILAVGMTAGAFARAHDQDPAAQGGAPRGEGRRGGPGGPDGAGGPVRFGGPGGPMGMLPRLGRDVELTAAQRDQVKAIADTHKDEWKALFDRARTAHVALNDAVTAATIDESLIRLKSADVAAVDADLAVARARTRVAVWQILTDEQKSKVKTRGKK